MECKRKDKGLIEVDILDLYLIRLMSGCCARRPARLQVLTAYLYMNQRCLQPNATHSLWGTIVFVSKLFTNGYTDTDPDTTG